MSLAQLLQLSRFYGAGPQWVVAGGGNSSLKENETLYVKASGTALAEASDETFVRMDRARLAAVLRKQYPADADERERQALQDLIDARQPGEQRRPSIETLTHELIPHTFVIHTHPPLINGLTCSVEAEAAAQRVFGGEAVWIPSLNSGLVLATAVRDAIAVYRERHGAPPPVILLQNHGLMVGADSADEVHARHKRVVGQVKEQISRFPQLANVPYDGQRAELIAYQISKKAQELDAGSPDHRSVFLTNREIMRFVRSGEAFASLACGFTPGNVVYAGHRIPCLQLSDDIPADKQAVAAALAGILEETGRIPPVVAVEGLGVFINGRNAAMMEAAAASLLDSVQIAVYAESFGGVSPLPAEQIEFILSREIERYRADDRYSKKLGRRADLRYTLG